MAHVQSEYPKDSRPPPEAEIVEITGDGSTTFLVLQANIVGRDQRVRLRIDDIQDFDVSGPAGVAELRAIRGALEELVRLIRSDRETE